MKRILPSLIKVIAINLAFTFPADAFFFDNQKPTEDPIFIDPMSIVYEQMASTAITPIPLSIPYNEDKAALGERLYFDPVLSVNQTVSCATCHQLKTFAGSNGIAVSHGVFGKKGELNSPTVFNSVFNLSQFWDGRAPNLKEQAKGPLFNPVEMGHVDWGSLEKILLEKSNYAADFKRLYPETGLTLDNLADTIAEFEKTLITPNARFDQFLKGNENALTQREKKGYALFQNLGCIACHNGINIGGNIYQKAGVFEKFSSLENGKWLGRFHITKNPSDKFYLKVPTLRNIALTPPYFHDGEVATLAEAIRLMVKHQLGKTATEEEIALLEAFLKTLNGEYQGVPLESHQ